jgi:hypothetical protein
MSKWTSRTIGLEGGGLVSASGGVLVDGVVPPASNWAGAACGVAAAGNANQRRLHEEMKSVGVDGLLFDWFRAAEKVLKPFLIRRGIIPVWPPPPPSGRKSGGSRRRK